MKILVLGGTRFFGIPMVKALLEDGHEVTIATRGKTPDSFGDRVRRIALERTSADSMKEMLAGKRFDTVIDKIAYSSNDIRYAMEALDCGQYIQMSSTAVYQPKHMNIAEEEFDGTAAPVKWCCRQDFPYAEIKRQAEYALRQKYADRNWIAVRYPFVIGKDDYTGRLRFYVEHAMKGVPMMIDNPDCQMGFIRSDEAGRFLAFLAGKDFRGGINGCSEGTVSVREILDYVEAKTGRKAVLSPDGDPAPYNGEPAYSIRTDRAKTLGFRFSALKDWVFDLLDYYIGEIEKTEG